MNENFLKDISEIFRALSSKERIKALGEFSKDNIKLNTISQQIGMSRSGFQNVINDFRDCRLIKETGHRSYYKISLKGKKILETIDELTRILQKLEPQERNQRIQQLEQAFISYGSGLTREDVLDLLDKIQVNDH